MSSADQSRYGFERPAQEQASVLKLAPHAGTLVQFSEPVPYAEAWTLQKQLQEERIAERRGDTLLLLEHRPVYTLGRSTKPTHWSFGEGTLRQTGASLQPVDRGGSITYHGPGQVVGYPILKLSRYCSGPKQYVWKLEDVLIRTLARWGLDGYRLEKKPGVWVRWDHADAKIAAIGIRIDRGVTIHGFSLNVDLNLAPFSHILPCGLTQCHITSMAEIRQSAVSSSAVAQQVAQDFARLFDIEWIALPPDSMGLERHDRCCASTSALPI
jgi:lipoyl(octanoyl) transferase